MSLLKLLKLWRQYAFVVVARVHVTARVQHLELVAAATESVEIMLVHIVHPSGGSKVLNSFRHKGVHHGLLNGNGYRIVWKVDYDIVASVEPHKGLPEVTIGERLWELLHVSTEGRAPGVDLKGILADVVSELPLR